MPIRPESRQKFEYLSLPFVKADVFVGMAVKDQDERREAVEWIREQEEQLAARDSFRFWAMLLFTVVAAVAACIAAWPIVKEWMLHKA
jgi:hypothetical protein